MLKIRPAEKKDAFAIATINTFGWKTAYRGLIPDNILDAMEVTEKRIKHTEEAIATV